MSALLIASPATVIDRLEPTVLSEPHGATARRPGDQPPRGRRPAADGPVADGPVADGPAADGPAADDSPVADGPAADHDTELAALAGRLGCATTDRALLRQAMSHRSWCAEHGGVPSNERLEFLGDSVLGIIVTDFTFREYPDLDESELSRLRAAVVSASALADVASGLDLGAALLLGKGEAATGGRTKTSILADGLEAVIGAVYLDRGWDDVNDLVLALLGDHIADAARGPGEHDFKSILQELVAQRGDSPPTYALSEVGPDHRKTFNAVVSVAGTAMGEGEGSTKKAAEQVAAEAALDALRPASDADGR